MRIYENFDEFIELVEPVTTEEQHIKIDGYTGRWSSFEKVALDGATYYIYENDYYGDMTNFLVIQFIDDMPINVFETYDNIAECLKDNEIIDF